MSIKRLFFLVSLALMFAEEGHSHDTKHLGGIDRIQIEILRQETNINVRLAQARSQKPESQYPEAYLKVGTIITITKRTPLMPELHPSNMGEALSNVRTIYPGSSVLVKRVIMSNGVPWFEVDVIAKGHGVIASGWINGAALEGQN